MKNWEFVLDQDWHGDASLPNSEMSLPEIAGFISEFEEDAEAIAQAKLQPWLRISEIGYAWLVSMHICLSRLGKSHVWGGYSAPWAISGAACTNALGLRRLCLSGVDFPARSVMRVLIETLHICIVILANDKLAESFRTIVNEDEARRFWHNNFARGKLRRLLAKIEYSLNIDPDIRNLFRILDGEELSMASRTIHVTYLTGVMASMPRKLQDPGRREPGVFGLASTNSIRTLRSTALAIAQLSMLWHGLILRSNITVWNSTGMDQFDRMAREAIVRYPLVVFKQLDREAERESETNTT